MFVSPAITLLLLFGTLALPQIQQDTKEPEIRTVEIVGADDMKYDVTRIVAQHGEQIRIRLKSVGKVPKVVMAHNVLILQPTVDVEAFGAAASMTCGTNFIPPSKKATSWLPPGWLETGNCGRDIHGSEYGRRVSIYLLIRWTLGCRHAGQSAGEIARLRRAFTQLGRTQTSAAGVRRVGHRGHPGELAPGEEAHRAHPRHAQHPS